MLFLLLLLSSSTMASSKNKKMKLAIQQKKQEDVLLQYVSIAKMECTVTVKEKIRARGRNITKDTRAKQAVCILYRSSSMVA